MCFARYAGLLAILSLSARAQSSAAAERPDPASLTGVVTSQRTGRPLPRANVVLKPTQTGLAPLSDTTDEKGRYSFPDAAPGRYEIEVSRDGYLPSSSGWLDTYRFPPVFNLLSGANLAGLNFHLYPWGIVSGRVAFNDADPTVGAEVVLYRDMWMRGRHIYRIAARAHTDDRGEYRLHGLAPGTYFLSAAWSKPAPAAGARTEPRRDEKGQPLADESYAVTFYPSVQKLVEAAPIKVGYGDEVGAIDIFLSTARTVRVKGHVTSGATGVLIPTPGLSLRRVGADEAIAVDAAMTLNLDHHGGFELSGVTRGTYYVVAEADEAGKRLTGRKLVTVTEEPIENLEILAVPQITWKGRIKAEGENAAKEEMTAIGVSLEPRDDTAPAASASVHEDGSFEFDFVPDEIYDIYLENLPEGTYLGSARSGAADLLVSGLKAPPGSAPDPIEIKLSRSGGRVAGVVLNEDRTVAPGVRVDVIPDPPQGRYGAFQSTYANEYGSFELSGLVPGRYIMMAWGGEAPCDIYNPNDLEACLAAGARVTVTSDGQETVTLLLAVPKQ
jgi:hypothetical protein